MKKPSPLYLILALSLAFSSIFAQVKVKSLPGDNLTEIDSSFFNSSAQRKIVSFNQGWKIFHEASPQNKSGTNVPASFEGEPTLVFEKDFELSQSEIDGSVLRLVCLGINYSAEISLNGFNIYKHLNGEIPFSLELPRDILKSENKNKLTLKINHQLDSESTVPLLQRFLFPANLGGITRDIYLEIMPRLNIFSQRINFNVEQSLTKASVEFNLKLRNAPDVGQQDPESGNSGNIKISVSLSSPASTVKKEIEIPGFAGEYLDTTMWVEVGNPVLWSPSDPVNYNYSITLIKNNQVIDSKTGELPIYRIEKRDNGFLLNGQPFSFQGTTYLPTDKNYGNLISYKKLSDDLTLIKRSGFNSVRFSKQYPNPVALYLCQKIGLFAFIENPLNSLPEELLEKPNFEEQIKSSVRAMLDAYSQYKAVAAIGIGSSFLPDSKLTAEFIDHIASLIHNQTGLLTYASYVGFLPERINSLDIYGIELYSDLPTDSRWTDYTSQISPENLFISEASYPNYFGTGNGYLNPFTIEAQAKYFENLIDTARRNKLAGFFINSIFSYQGDFNSLYAEFTDNKEYKVGIIGDDRNLNSPAYRVIYSKLTQGAKITIPIGNKKQENPIQFILIALALSILLAVLINTSKKFREDCTRALIRPYNFFADVRDHRILSGAHALILMLVLSGAFSLLVTILLNYYRTNILLEKIVLAFGQASMMDRIGYLAWNPTFAFIEFFIISLIGIVLLSIFIKVASFFIKTRVDFPSIIYTVIWALLPISLMLPVELILFKILSLNIINIYIYGFLALYLLWLVQRVAKGIYVIFDIRPFTVYFYTILVIFVIGGGIILYYHLANDTIYYVVNAVKQFYFISI